MSAGGTRVAGIREIYIDPSRWWWRRPTPGASRGHGARRDHTINAFQYREASDTSALTQTVPRRRAAPVRDGAPSNPKGSEPSRRLQYSRRLVKVAVGVRVERVVEA